MSSNENVKPKGLIYVDFFQNIGMLKIDFNIHPRKMQINNFFYSVYGNNGFTLKGAFDISQLGQNDSLPSLFFRTSINNVYFVKVKFLLNGIEREECKFVDLIRLKKKENINMNIMDRSVEDLFNSINLENEGESESDGTNSCQNEENEYIDDDNDYNDVYDGNDGNDSNDGKDGNDGKDVNDGNNGKDGNNVND